MKGNMLLVVFFVGCSWNLNASAEQQKIYYEEVKPILVWVKEYLETKKKYNEFNLSQTTREYDEFDEHCRKPVNNLLRAIYSLFGSSLINDIDSVPDSSGVSAAFFGSFGSNPPNKQSVSNLLLQCDELVNEVIVVQKAAHDRAEKKKQEKYEADQRERESKKKASFDKQLSAHVSLVVESYTCLALLDKSKRQQEAWYQDVTAIAKHNGFVGVYSRGMESYIKKLQESAASPVSNTLIRMSPTDSYKAFDQANGLVLYSNDYSGVVLAEKANSVVVMGSELNADWIAFVRLGSYDTILGTRKQFFMIERIDGQKIGLPNSAPDDSQYCAISKDQMEEAMTFIKNSQKDDVLIRQLNESFDKHGLPRMSL